MAEKKDPQLVAEGRRLKLVRLAEGYESGLALCARLKWQSSGLSQFETGQRRIPMEKMLELRRIIPGFDAAYIWDGDKRGLSYDLRRRIEELEDKENPRKAGLLARAG